ncbi:MAG: hypothetical protein RIC06_05840 [Cyclobacteriaceae bacterium]
MDATDDFSGMFSDLVGVPTNLDTDATDDFSGQWGDLIGIPSGFLDGADDVDDADADPGNEFQDLSFDPLTNTLSITDDPDGIPVNLTSLAGGISSIIGTPGDVLKYQALLGWQAGTDEVDDADADPDNELQSLQFEGTAMWLSMDPEGSMVDLSIYNTDVLAGLDPAEGQIAKFLRGSWVVVDDEVDDLDNDPTNEMEFPTTAELGQVMKFTDAGTWEPGSDLVDDGDSDPTNEFQTITRTGSTVTLSDGGGTFSINDGDSDPNNEIEFPTTAPSGYVMKYSTVTSSWSPQPDLQGSATTPWSEGTDAIGNFVEYTGHAKALNMVGTSVTLDETAIGSSVLKRDVYKSARIVRLNVLEGYMLTGIEAGIDGQEIIFVNVGSGQFTFDNSRGDGSNLFLPSAIVTLQRGGTLTLMYVDDKDAGFGGWVPLAGVGSVQVPK